MENCKNAVEEKSLMNSLNKLGYRTKELDELNSLCQVLLSKFNDPSPIPSGPTEDLAMKEGNAKEPDLIDLFNTAVITKMQVIF